ncbi:carboxypeptidase-like regulatory domain-containing protein, partial [Algoriella sp.]|uniref:carboxypeptidase-like regulatory domain-containing protein n=1 Tax=Algoriella sp. TaxID=1872434 RepID=UPI001B24DFC6
MKKTTQQPTLRHSKRFLSTISLSLLGGLLFAQTAQVTGKVVDENRIPISEAEVILNDKSYYTDQNGNFKIEIPSNQSVTITFNTNGYSSFAQTLNLKDKNKKEIFVQLVPDKSNAIQLEEATITFQSNKNKPLQSTTLSAAQMQQ